MFRNNQMAGLFFALACYFWYNNKEYQFLGITMFACGIYYYISNNNMYG